MPKLLRLALTLLVIAGFAYIVIASMHTPRYQVQVCVDYHGMTACRDAEGRTQSEAQRGALDNACSQIVFGVTGTIGCQDTPPTSIKLLRAP